MIRRGSSSVCDYYHQLNFNATNFENIKIEVSMLGMLSYYKIHNDEYSIDGIVFNKVGEYNLAQDSTWYHETFQLPENVNGTNSIMVRFKADKS